jgi:hypothetical protein
MCRVCGAGPERGTQFSSKHGMALCILCEQDTPIKVTMDEFNRLYWGAGFENVPLSTRREFFSDYMTSTLTLKQYIMSTTGGDEL